MKRSVFFLTTLFIFFIFFTNFAKASVDEQFLDRNVEKLFIERSKAINSLSLTIKMAKYASAIVSLCYAYACAKKTLEFTKSIIPDGTEFTIGQIIRLPIKFFMFPIKAFAIAKCFILASGFGATYYMLDKVEF